jgi:hypothetical protein
VDPVFALDAQGGDIASLLVIASLALTSLLLALRGSWWATAIPGALFALGAAAYLTSEPDPPWGGDSDPGRLIGAFLLYAGGAWLLVALAVVLLVRRLR